MESTLQLCPTSDPEEFLRSCGAKEEKREK